MTSAESWPIQSSQTLNGMKQQTHPIYQKPRLMLLGMEACEYPALQIWAHVVVDGAGNNVCGAHSKGEAERIRDRYTVQYPQRAFYVQ